jgi:hypothetical protein
MKVIISGSGWLGETVVLDEDVANCDVKDARKIIKLTMNLLKDECKPEWILSTHARGAEIVGEWWAEQNGIPVIYYETMREMVHDCDAAVLFITIEEMNDPRIKKMINLLKTKKTPLQFYHLELL